MGMEHWWNGTDRGKLKYWERNLSQCHFIHHIDGPGIELGPWGERPATNRRSQGTSLHLFQTGRSEIE
jgi:hypothetical protein